MTGKPIPVVYNPIDGLFYRRGRTAGTINKAGYVVISYYNKLVLAHRLAWIINYGYWPEQVDHINGKRYDNRLSNLSSRVATQLASIEANSDSAHAACVFPQALVHRRNFEVKGELTLDLDDFPGSPSASFPSTIGVPVDNSVISAFLHIAVAQFLRTPCSRAITTDQLEPSGPRPLIMFRQTVQAVQVPYIRLTRLELLKGQAIEDNEAQLVTSLVTTEVPADFTKLILTRPPCFTNKNKATVFMYLVM